MMKIIKWFLRIAIYLLLFAVLSFYAMAFNTALGWSLLAFFILVFALNFLSFLPSLKKYQVTIPESIYAYRLQTITIEFSLWRQPVSLFFLGKIQLSFPNSPSNQVELIANRGKRQQVQLSWQAQERGVTDSLPIELVAQDLFGFLKKSVVINSQQEVTVLPEKKSQAHVLLHFFKKQRQLSLIGENNFTIKNYREYQAGDPIKYIDWKLSSKQQTIMYREQEVDVDQQIVLVFWGQASADFEEALSWYYSLQNILPRNLNYFQIVCGDVLETGTLIKTETFATVRPFTKTPELQQLRGAVLVIAPELTPELEMAFSAQKKKQVELFDVKRIRKMVNAYEEADNGK